MSERDQDRDMTADGRSGHRRRDVLLGATGLVAAAAVVGGASGGVAHAGKPAGPITGSIEPLGEFEVLSYSWGASNTGTTHVGGGGGAGKANVQDLSFTKYTDAISPKLFLAVVTGQHFASAVLNFTAKSGWPAIAIETRDVLVTSLSTGGSTGDAMPTENVTLNFERVRYIVDGVAADWDIAGNKAD